MLESFRATVYQKALELALGRFDERSDTVREITEGRIAQPKYAWCGDFVSYVLMVADATERGCLNRVACIGEWRVGKNIAMIVSCARERGASYEGPRAYARLRENRAADIIVFTSDTGGHICFLKNVNSASSIETMDGNWGERTNVTLRGMRDRPIGAVIDVDCFYDGEIGAGPPTYEAPDVSPVLAVSSAAVAVLSPATEIFSAAQGHDLDDADFALGRAMGESA